jgi:signal peptidase I
MNIANDSKTEYESHIFYLRGSSMVPLIKPGSKVFVDSSIKRDYRPGDIICFLKNSSTLFAHRLIKWEFHNEKKFAVEKGDNVYGFSLIPYEQIIGKVIKIENNKFIIDLNSSKWRSINAILAKIAYIQVLLLKAIPYSYHRDPIIKRIPHYFLKLLFTIIILIFIALASKRND